MARKFCGNLKHVLPEQEEGWCPDFVEVSLLLWGTKQQDMHGDCPKQDSNEVVTQNEFNIRRWCGFMIHNFVDPDTLLNHTPHLVIEKQDSIVTDGRGDNKKLEAQVETEA